MSKVTEVKQEEDGGGARVHVKEEVIGDAQQDCFSESQHQLSFSV